MTYRYQDVLEKEAGPKPRQALAKHRCAICGASPPLTADFHPGAVTRPRWEPDHRSWLIVFKMSQEGYGGYFDPENVFICPACVPLAVGALHAEREKQPKRGCGACGAPHGEKCTPSCDDDATPEGKVERWMPETFPSELDLLAADE